MSQLIKEILRNPSIIYVVIGTFFFWVSLYLYVPILPNYSKDLGASATMIGYIVAAYAIGQMILRIPLGIAVDKWGTKPFAIITMLCSALGSLGLTLASDPIQLFLARSVTGVAGAGWVAISLLFASQFQNNLMHYASSFMMGINGIAITISTLISGRLADYFGDTTPFIASLFVSILGMIVFFASKENKKKNDKKNYNFYEILGSTILIRISIIAIGFHFVTFGVNFGFLPIIIENLGGTKTNIGDITTLSQLAGICGMSLSAWFINKIGTRKTIILGSICMIISLIFTSYVENLSLIATLQFISGFGRGILYTVTITLILISFEETSRGLAMGAYQAYYAIGMFLGPALSGLIVNSFGINAIFWLSTLITLLALIIGIYKPYKTKLHGGKKNEKL
ncbi:MAG: MFS transporter [Dehalococcoidia bacterium]|nr:MFS transporter [Dehalococcoidia bacterium]